MVDGVRAVAALAVVMQHAALVSGASSSPVFGAVLGNGNQGVAAFFIISGFLLYRPFVWAQLGGAPAPRTRDYLRRRVLRIVPAYWLALTVLALYPGLPDMFDHHWWRYYLFLSVYSPLTTVGGLFVAWSLCVEVAFYLALPLYARAVQRLLRRVANVARVRWELVVLAAVGVSSVALRLLVGLGGTFVNTLPAFLLWFALGMGLAVVSASSQRNGHAASIGRALGRRPGLVWLAAAGGYGAVCLVVGRPPQLGVGTSTLSQTVWGYYVLGGVTALLFVLPAVLGPDAGAWPQRVLGQRWLGWLGLVSYGIYLWHATLLDLLAKHGVGSWLRPAPFVALLAVGLGAATLCAAVSYYLLERPVLKLKDRRRPER